MGRIKYIKSYLFIDAILPQALGDTSCQICTSMGLGYSDVG